MTFSLSSPITQRIDWAGENDSGLVVSAALGIRQDEKRGGGRRIPVQASTHVIRTSQLQRCVLREGADFISESKRPFPARCDLVSQKLFCPISVIYLGLPELVCKRENDCFDGLDVPWWDEMHHRRTQI